jgi:chaperone required for assembly of F1-ATPase
VKRFWKEVSVEPDGEDWTIKVDGRPVKTPARAPLAVPSRALAEAIADEWRSIDETIDPRAMPLTGIANAAIDRVTPEREAFAQGLANYAEADLACYRAEGPRQLADRQTREWDPLLGWARRRFDVDFATTVDLMHVAQPEVTVKQLSHELVAALALLEKAITPEQAWHAVSVDERWQLEQWGADAEAEAALENRHRDFLAAARFLELLD